MNYCARYQDIQKQLWNFVARCKVPLHCIKKELYSCRTTDCSCRCVLQKMWLSYRTPSTLTRSTRLDPLTRIAAPQGSSTWGMILRHGQEMTRHHKTQLDPNTFVMFASDHSSQRLTLEALPHLAVFLAHLFKEWKARPTLDLKNLSFPCVQLDHGPNAGFHLHCQTPLDIKLL